MGYLSCMGNTAHGGTFYNCGYYYCWGPRDLRQKYIDMIFISLWDSVTIVPGAVSRRGPILISSLTYLNLACNNLCRDRYYLNNRCVVYRLNFFIRPI